MKVVQQMVITPAPETTPYAPKAHDVLQETVVFLKDSWRIDLPDIQAEGQVYVTLKEAGVHHVPQCLASGDILSPQYHATKTHIYAAALSACHSDTHLIPHQHCRLALDVVGRVLVEYRTSY